MIVLAGPGMSQAAPPPLPPGCRPGDFDSSLPLFTFSDLDRFVAPVARRLAEAQDRWQRATQDSLGLAVWESRLSVEVSELKDKRLKSETAGSSV